jgi:hypothetical protein
VRALDYDWDVVADRYEDLARRLASRDLRRTRGGGRRSGQGTAAVSRVPAEVA